MIYLNLTTRLQQLLFITFFLLTTFALYAQTDCTNLPTWSSSAVYNGGDQVQYQDIAYEAKWWTQNENPASNSAQWDVWKVLGNCSGGGGGGGTTNTPPNGSITSPAEGASFTSGNAISISANASDADGSVTNVEFLADGSVIGQDASSPYSFSWSGATAGNHQLTIRVTDNDGATATSSTVNITVTAPPSGDCNGTPQYVEAGGYDAGSQVQNAGNIYQCREWPNSGWCDGGAAAYAPGSGTHWQDAWTFVAECGGGSGGGSNSAPNVAITSPANNTTFSPGTTINISADASDTDGAIAKVAFYEDGTLLGEDTTAPYSYSWSGAPNGSHALTAIATDNENATTTSTTVYVSVSSGGTPNPGLPDRVLVGYWHNFDNGSGVVKLRDVSPKWDVINIAFAEPTTQGGATMAFTPDNAIYSTKQEFKNDVAYLQSQGKKVLISIGGANGTIHLDNSQDAQSFSTTMTSIINEYGFDGLDIDLEGSSLSLAGGDTDFRNPVSPRVVYFIQGMDAVLANFGTDFILTAAPETAYVQGGYSTYGGIFGAYLPVLYHYHNRLDLLHVQHYNTGCMLGLDDQCYSQGTADFHVAMGEMLMQGFPVAGNPTSFPAFRQDQIAIGLPASPSAAGGGYTATGTVIQALDYLIKGQSFGGNYTLINTAGYSSFRGLMTWSINWDINYGYEFSNTYRAYLDGLPAARSASRDRKEIAIKLGPNPMTNHLYLTLPEGDPGTRLHLYNQAGQLMPGFTDTYERPQQTWDVSGLSSGLYLLHVLNGEEKIVYKLIKP